MNSKRLLPLCGLICATAMLGACVGQGSSNAANESMYLEQRVQEHDTLLRQMQPAQAEVWNQVQAMRQELNTLKGLVDDLKNVGGAAALAERVRAHDAALRQVETSMALNLNLGEPMAPLRPMPPRPRPMRPCSSPSRTPMPRPPLVPLPVQQPVPPPVWLPALTVMPPLLLPLLLPLRAAPGASPRPSPKPSPLRRRTSRWPCMTPASMPSRPASTMRPSVLSPTS